MRCPTLAELPPPPPGKTGWPWTEESPQLPETMPDGSPWPRISIVTPSYNQGQFLEETIRSVLLQGYPDVEYIIIDGGSTDESVEIIRKYEPWLAYWVSEPDRGQSHAINKGFERSTGEIMAWINSDDYYFPNVLRYIAENWDDNVWYLGQCEQISGDGLLLKTITPPLLSSNVLDNCLKSNHSLNFDIAQPGNFWSRKLWFEIGYLNEKYHYCMDLDWVLRALSKGYHPVFINKKIACMRKHSDSKTISFHWRFKVEGARILLDLSGRRILKLKPSIRIARYFASKGLIEKSDLLFQQGDIFSSLLTLFASILITDSIKGKGYLTRVKRFFSFFKAKMF